MNIIADRMYPTKEGYTALLRKQEIKYFIDVSFDKNQTEGFAEIPCTINYEYKGEKNAFKIVATVKKDSYSSPDQLRGKAERRAKKALYEFITGSDFGEADENSSRVEDANYTDVSDNVENEIKGKANQGGKLAFDNEPKAEETKPEEKAATPAQTQNGTSTQTRQRGF